MLYEGFNGLGRSLFSLYVSVVEIHIKLMCYILSVLKMTGHTGSEHNFSRRERGYQREGGKDQ